MKRTYHRWGSPRYFYGYAQKGVVIAGCIAALGLITGLLWGLLFAPEDYQQGNSFRIIYIHVPAASLAMSAYAMIASCAFVSWVWKMKMADVVAEAAAPIGACFTFLALFTGAVWGKPTWGTYWVWDARLTSMLILLFLYIGLIALRQSIASVSVANKMCNVLALVGVINLPIIKYSVEWWNTLHQPATFTVTDKPAMPPEMWIPLLISLIGVYALFAALVFYRANTLILSRERRGKWVKEKIKNAI